MKYVEEQQANLVVKYEIEEYLNEPTYKPKNNGHMPFLCIGMLEVE